MNDGYKSLQDFRSVTMELGKLYDDGDYELINNKNSDKFQDNINGTRSPGKA